MAPADLQRRLKPIKKSRRTIEFFNRVYATFVSWLIKDLLSENSNNRFFLAVFPVTCRIVCR